MKRRLTLLVTSIMMVLMMAGCSEINKPITKESTGFWNEYIVYPLSYLINYTADLFGGNYGLAIIVVTILVRLAIFPLMLKQMRSSKAMQAIQPEMTKLKEKYTSKDVQTQQELQKATMALWQAHGVNPLAGCLPLIVQMPILIGFYHAISRTQEIKAHHFLWFDLGLKDPYYILPLLAGVLTFIQSKMMAKGVEQNPQMAMMTWMMPIMIVVFAVNFPSALSLYWVVGNIFMIVQTYFIKAPKKKDNVIVTGSEKK